MSSISQTRFEEIISKFSDLDPILVVGDVGIDKYTYGEVNRISPEAPVPVLEVTKEWHKLGLAANVTDNLKSLEVESTLCGVTGMDRNGDLFDELLEERSLKTWGIVRSDSRQTTFKERVTTSMQQVCRVDYETSTDLDDVSRRKVLDRVGDFSGEHSSVILEDYGKGLFTETLTKDLITHFKNQGKMIFVDPSRTTPALYYKGASLLKPNRVESEVLARQLGYAEKNIETRLEVLAEKLDLDMIIITLGADGMALLDRKNNIKPTIIPTVASEVFDVSGAGDTAISAIAAALSSGATLEEAAWVGNCASGVVVAKKGTARVNRAELLEFFIKISKQFK